MVATNEYLLLKKRVRELEELNRLSESLTTSVNVDEILKKIVDAILNLCKAERVALILFDPSLKTTAQTLVRGANDGESQIDHRINLLVASWIEKHKKPLLSDNISESLSLKGASARAEKFGPVLAVPLEFDGKSIGIINLVNSKQGDCFDEDALRLARIIARQAGKFIQQAKLCEMLFEDNRRLKSELCREHEWGILLGECKQMQDVFQSITIVSQANSTVLLTGETGTGKELVARAIHFKSLRAAKPFMAVNCAAIPASLFESELFGHERGAFTGATEMRKGKFELADTGTLFLDEIGEMPYELQPKLLRVLEERNFSRLGSSTEIKVDVRVIAATSKDLILSADEGKFRHDLFHRLNVIPIHLPSLRDRSEDIILLANNFLEEFSSGSKKFSTDALELFKQMPWRGNVRELRNTIERICLFVDSKLITVSELRKLNISPQPNSQNNIALMIQTIVKNNQGNKDILESTEKLLVKAAIKEANGNLSEAARILGIDRKALERRSNKYGLSKRNGHNSK
jgi:transcriptional regulator with GAF, ATPase, and Fis domain